MAETASILSPGEDRPAARPRRRLLAGRLDHRRPAAGVEGQVPRRDRRHVRQHHGRGEGGDRLLLHVGQRGRASSSTSTASTARTPRSCSGRTCSSARSWRSGPAADARVGRRVPRPRRHPPARHRRDARRAPGRRLPHPPRVRLLDLGHGVRRRRRRRPRGRAHALDRRDARLRAQRRAGRDRDRGDRDRDAAPAARGGAGRDFLPANRGGGLPVHEDDHAAEAARRPARPVSRW